MNKVDIKEDLLSNIEIELEDTLFYIPGEIIKGTIKLKPKLKLNIKKLNLNLKLLQYEFWEYINTEIKEFKNVYKSEIKTKSFEYNLKDEENPDYKDQEKLGNLSFIVFEKEEEKIINIPFEFSIEKNDKKLLPTFQYETKDYILGIRHLLTVNCEEYNSTNYLGLFIGKQKDEAYDRRKEEKYEFVAGIKFIDVKLKYDTQTYYFGENIKAGLNIKSKHILRKDIEILETLYRKIEWVGYLKNTVLDKTILDQKKELNESNKSGIGLKRFNLSDDDDYIDIDEDDDLFMISLFFYPFMLVGKAALLGLKGIVGGAIGAVSGGLMAGGVGAPVGGIIGFIMGANTSGVTVPTIGLVEEENKHEFQSDKTNLTKKENCNELNELLKKFVYFKGDKIVGFVKFKMNITPPVEGYYFKCEFNMKFELMVKGVVFNSYRPIKDQIYFYDGPDYIQNMKNLLNTNKGIINNS